MKKSYGVFGLVFLFLLLSNLSHSQTISGKVTDATTSEVLIDAIVKVKNMQAGAATDLDGRYLIEGLEPGTYDLEFSYIGYLSKTITGVTVTAGQNTVIDVALQIEGIQTEEIVIEATTSTANEQALLLEQKNSSKIQDGISEQQIKRAPDAAASDVLKRVIGVNIVNDKFVFVRGTTDRYSLTTLNGVQLPSSEPDKKAFSFDLFPSNLLENIIIAKTFTPDQPGSFSGGLVQVTTKEFPEALTYGINISNQYLSGSTGKQFRTYDAGETSWLFLNSGLDDGSRQLPGDIPGNQLISQNYSPEQLSAFGQSFRNDWGQTFKSAPVNSSFQLSIGNRFNIGENPLGVFAAYSYRTGFVNSDVTRTTYNTDFSLLDSLNGKKSTFEVLQGGIINLNLKLGLNNKITTKNTFSITSDDETSFSEGVIRRVSEDEYDSKLYYTRFAERVLYNTTLGGEHYLPKFGNVNISWVGSYSKSTRNEPDTKAMTYQRLGGSEDEYSARVGSVPASEGGSRLFTKLTDYNRTFNLNFDIPFIKLENNPQSKLKIGGYLNTTSRSYDARNFAPRLNGSFFLLFYGLDSIFKPDHFAPNRFVMNELTREEDNYSATEENYATYAMFDVPYNRFRFVGGARYEYNRQQVGTLGRIGQPINSDLKNIDILPSLNITYSLNEISNLRVSVSQTVSRPELREISPSGYTDFLAGINVVGNPNLERSLVQNYDLRYEIFPGSGEIFSISAFFKHFNQPIEEVFSPGQNNPEKTFENFKGGADNYGVEIELRKNLGFLSKTLKDFSFNGNLSLVNSKVNFEGITTGQTEDENRRMQGQAPYTINLGLYYDNYNSGTSLNILFNKFGRRVAEVGNNGYNDIEEDGPALLDFTASQKIFERFEAKFSVKNILQQNRNYYQKISDVEKLVRSISTGTGFSLSLGYKF
ncbi:MAG: carboxypeptidase regulatory-like domain-containing protein [Ignavibacteria bacterium]|nr:carboxypeptidase regulatory-like domain-containing protein [Ignavibacteria bacterium]